MCCEFGISKFPTLGHVRKGVKHRKEYRGQRTKQALVDHATRLAEDPIVLLDSVDHFRSSVLPTRATLLAFTDEPANRSEAYDVYRDVSHSLRDDCDFYWVSGLAKTTFADHNQNDHIAFKAAKESWLSSSNLSRFDLPLSPRTFKDFLSWASRLCLPVVREITFDNAEELTEERLPFVILFYVGQYQKSIRLFREVIERELMHEYGKVNFLLADGDRFHYPLMHLGRTKQDLPLIVIDSFQHMFMFPNYEHIK